MDMDTSRENSWKEDDATPGKELDLATEATPAALTAEQATDVTDSTQMTGGSPLDFSADIPKSRVKGSNDRKGLLDEATEFINEHIRIFRQLPWVIGGVGVVLLVRFYPRMAFRRYQRTSDIPRQLIENNVKLTGIVAMTGWNSVGVWHVPLWRRVLRLRHQPIGQLSHMTTVVHYIISLFSLQIAIQKRNC